MPLIIHSITRANNFEALRICLPIFEFPSFSSSASSSLSLQSSMVLSGTSKGNNTLMARKGMPNIFLSSSKTLSPNLSFQGSPISSSLFHSFSESMMEENIENAESIITKWDPNSSSIYKVTSLFQHNRKEAKNFLKSVKGLRQAMHYLVSNHSTSNKLVLAQNLMQIAMKRLEKEFYQILAAYSDQIDPESFSGGSSDATTSFEDEDKDTSTEEIRVAGESIPNVEKVTAQATCDLNSIADCMISAGYGKECVKIYKLARKSSLDEGLYQLGVESFRSSLVQKMSWEALEHTIRKWLIAVKMAVRTLFNGEKVLCDHVFSASQKYRESCFSEISKEGAINLFRFPDLIAKNKKLPERIFPLLELHETLSDLKPDIELIFNSELTSEVKLQALSSIDRLGASVCNILSDFESSILKDSSKTPITGGGIHPLTERVMSYICSLADYSRSLSNILNDYPLQRNITLPESYFDSPESDDASPPAVSVHLARLILVLLCKLDSKSEQYKDVSLSYLFLANNLHFIVRKTCSTALRTLIGEEWVIKHAKTIKQYASNYEKMAWTKVMSTLPDKASADLSPEVAKECFQKFRAAFEEAHRKQTSWIVPDGKLRDVLKMSIKRNLVPAYREFYDTYFAKLSGEKNLEILVRFGPDELENCLSYLFQGATISDSSSPFSRRGCIPK